MNQITFCFGIHNHQPVGNFGWVIDEAFAKAYLPFLNLLEKYPAIKISIHFSGILYDWMLEHYPQTITQIAAMVERGQLEILSGGYYDPILPVIPTRDKIAQIEMMNQFIKKNFAVTPQGMWLAERVWEPNLPSIIKEAGINFSILDDIHFKFSGLQDSDLNGYYITEDEGKTIALFPISKALRYAIPFKDPEDTVAYLRSLAEQNNNPIAIYADDGEKFGVWPETDILCYQKGWLEHFFQVISDNSDWIKMEFFSQVLEKTPPLGRVYLPTASYSEMNEWALPAERIELYEEFQKQLEQNNLLEKYNSYVKGGFWRNFLTKYWETNNLHKRMIYSSNLLDKYRSQMPAVDFDKAEKHLYAGQCNCTYWHGVFGGLYLPHLRGAAYQELIAAEVAVRNSAEQTLVKPQVEVLDFDADGNDDLVVTTNKLKAIISPAYGGMIVELDSFAAEKNLLDILSRRHEAYYNKLLKHTDQNDSGNETQSIHDRVEVKEEGLEKLLIYDKYRRGLFLDHFFEENTKLADFVNLKYHEAIDFINKKYDYSYREANNNVEINLKREGSTNNSPLTIQKTLIFNNNDSTIEVKYRLLNESEAKINLHFGSEVGFGAYTFPITESLASSEREIDLYKNTEITEINSFKILSKLYNLEVELSSEAEFDLWCHPLWTVSLSEGGFEKVYQGQVFVLRRQLEIEPQSSFELKFKYAIKI